jgi:serine protease Do
MNPMSLPSYLTVPLNRLTGWGALAVICWLLGTQIPLATELEAPGILQGATPTEERISEAVALEPTPARRDDLPWPFRKDAPNSLDDLLTMEKHIQDLVERVSRAVVAVRVGGSAGSGVIVSPDGWVLCAAHVGGGPDRNVRFTFPDGRTAQGKTFGSNHAVDSGLMKITDPGPWPYVDVAEPDDIRLGDWVLALGHPGGYDPERAVVARLGRVIRRSGLLQTDSTVVAGDSGGPLFDMHGRVVGIHSRISDSIAGNFHVPISTYIETWNRLVSGEDWGTQRSPSRTWIGVRVADHPEGCVLEDVDPDSPASRAGLRPGDIVSRINGEAIEDSDSFVNWIRSTRPNNEITMSVRRGNDKLNVTVQVAGRRRSTVD